MRVVVVGHVEHVEFVRVPRVPAPGAIVHASETWEEAAGGGGVACVQLAKLAGACTLFTALGDDARGHAVAGMLAARAAERGARVDVRAAWRSEPQRRAITFVDEAAERTITVIGARHQPQFDDALPWHELDGVDAVYFTAGAPEVLCEVRKRVRVVVATSRVLPILEEAGRLGVRLDAIVRSASDPGEPDPTPLIERPGSTLPAPRLVVATEGGLGGSYVERTPANDVVRSGRWVAAPLPGPAVDAYGCGDSFAAGLTFALGVNMSIDDALAFAARCGAACLTGAGPFAGQLALDNDDALRRNCATAEGE